MCHGLKQLLSFMMEERNVKVVHFRAVQFMHETGFKLRMKALPLASAATIYYKYFEEQSVTKYDPYLIATTAIYLAGKIEEEHVKLCDVVNVSYRVLHKDDPPLEIGSVYWSLRDTIIQCELFLLRVLKFQVAFVHPHKYLLNYLSSLSDWLHPADVARCPVARTAWSILQDSYHGDVCLRHGAAHVAVAVIYFALQCYGLEVPYTHDAETHWWQAFATDITIERIRTIISEIIDIYSIEIGF